MLFEHKIFTGVAGTHTMRLLPSLAMTIKEADIFLVALKKVLSKV
jgi:acetylornithine aminotransferase